MSEKSFDAISIGACNVDIIAFASKFPEAEEKISASGYIPPKSTGVALDCISQINALGLKCGHFGKVGNDEYGKIILKELNADGIDTSRIVVVSEIMTSKAWIIVNNKTGERCHIMFPTEPAGFITAEDVDKNADYITSARLVHMELLQMPIDGMIKAAELCKESGVKISFDLDIAPKYAYEYKYATKEQLMKMIKTTDILKACKNAAIDFCGHYDYEKAAKEMLELGPQVVIITIGENGCIVAYKNSDGKVNSFISPGFNGEKIKDTTGAGDAFQGGFLYGYLKGWSLERCAILANATGYLKSTKIGARSSTHYDVVEKFLKGYGWENLK
ncbi:carbohydrate kinase family protein [Thermoanaerobacteraceae bacterium SP2]|nr:carbohydrate kinase family protein [Thermoanaerobacteraceae bacterium SP2]